MGRSRIIWSWQGQRVDEKSNEITAIPELLELLDVEGTIITIDAMGTQTEIVAQIIREGGDYILALKGNQGNLHKGVKTFFEQAMANDWSGIDYSYSETTEAGHHRIEHRSFWVVPISQVPNLPNQKNWKGLATIVMVRRRRILTEYRNRPSVLLHHQSTRQCCILSQSDSLPLGH